MLFILVNFVHISNIPTITEYKKSERSVSLYIYIKPYKNFTKGVLDNKVALIMRYRF